MIAFKRILFSIVWCYHIFRFSETQSTCIPLDPIFYMLMISDISLTIDPAIEMIPETPLPFFWSLTPLSFSCSRFSFMQFYQFERVRVLDFIKPTFIVYGI